MRLNAVDLYLLVCIGLVFFALVEYAIILFLGSSRAENDTLSKSEPDNTNTMMPERVSSLGQTKTVTTKQAWNGPTRSQRNNIDSRSLIVFPLLFIVFNVIYWAIYY